MEWWVFFEQLKITQNNIIKVMLGKHSMYPLKLLSIESNIFNTWPICIIEILENNHKTNLYSDLVNHNIRIRATWNMNVWILERRIKYVNLHWTFLRSKIFNLLPLHLRNKRLNKFTKAVKLWIIDNHKVISISLESWIKIKTQD